MRPIWASRCGVDRLCSSQRRMLCWKLMVSEHVRRPLARVQVGIVVLQSTLPHATEEASRGALHSRSMDISTCLSTLQQRVLLTFDVPRVRAPGVPAWSRCCAAKPPGPLGEQTGQRHIKHVRCPCTLLVTVLTQALPQNLDMRAVSDHDAGCRPCKKCGVETRGQHVSAALPFAEALHVEFRRSSAMRRMTPHDWRLFLERSTVKLALHNARMVSRRRSRPGHCVWYCSECACPTAHH